MQLCAIRIDIYITIHYICYVVLCCVRAFSALEALCNYALYELTFTLRYTTFVTLCYVVSVHSVH